MDEDTLLRMVGDATDPEKLLDLCPFLFDMYCSSPTEIPPPPTQKGCWWAFCKNSETCGGEHDEDLEGERAEWEHKYVAEGPGEGEGEEEDWVYDGRGWDASDGEGRKTYEGCTAFWDRKRAQPYRHTNHFKQLLQSVQGLNASMGDMEQEVVGAFRDVHRVEDADHARKVLRQNKLTKHYVHVPYILNRLYGWTLPRFTCEQLELMMGMFKFCLSWHRRNKDEARKNFLGYPFLLTKMVGLVNGMDAGVVARLVPAVKSKVTRVKSDKVWARLERDLRNYHLLVEYNMFHP